MLAQAGPGTAIVPYGNRIYIEVVSDIAGFQEPRRPKPRGVTFAELPVIHREATQKLRKASRFAAFIEDDAAEAETSSSAF